MAKPENANRLFELIQGIRPNGGSFPRCRIAEGGVGGNFRENGNLGGKDELLTLRTSTSSFS